MARVRRAHRVTVRLRVTPGCSGIGTIAAQRLRVSPPVSASLPNAMVALVEAGRMLHRLARSAMLAAGLLVAWASCVLPASASAQGVTAPVLKWTKGGCQDTWCRTGWYASPAVADLDGDGRPEVIWADHRIVVVEGESGATTWTVNSPGGGRTWPDPVVVDVDADGRLEIVTAHGNGYVSVTRADGTAQGGWPRQPTPGRELRSLAAGDVDGDGDVEVAVASTVSDNQWHVLEHTGATRTGWPQQLDSDTAGYAAGCFNQNVGLADVDGDGRLELIGPNDTHYVGAFRDDGTAVKASALFGLVGGQPKPWARVGFHYSQAVDLRGYANCTAGQAPLEPRPNFADSAPTIADLDGDGTLEIVIVGNQYDCRADPYASLFHSPYVLRADRTRWAASGFDWTLLPVPDAAAAPLSEDYELIETVVPNPVVADLDGDGRKEILFESYDGRLHAYWLDRTEHGSWPYAIKKPGESYVRFGSPPAVVDLDGNGQAEVIVATWTQKGSNAGGQLLVLSATGTLLHAVDLPRASGQTWDGAMAAPTVADIDGDADLEVVIGTAHTGLVAYDLPGTSRARILWGTGRGSSQRAGTARAVHTLTVDGPTGSPNPVASASRVTLSVAARDSAGHAVTHSWAATCSPTLGGNGVFDAATTAAPAWTAPVNATAATASCTISVTVSDGSLSATGSHVQLVSPSGPVTASRRYFAEGATIPPFDCRFALVNPGPVNAAVTMWFLRSDGQRLSHALIVPALARRTVDAKSVAGLEAAEFSTLIESTAAIIADRTMTWGADHDAGHTETSIAEPATTWYLAEGATHSGFDLFYTIQNPNRTAASVAVRYLRPGGLAPLEKIYEVAAASRFNIWVDVEEFPEGPGTRPLSASDVSAQVVSDVPIIVERSMYLSTPAQPFRAGTASAGVTMPATSWFLAEGATGPFFDLFVLVANPNPVEALVRGTYLLPGGATLTKDYAVPPNSRFNVWVDLEEFPDGSGNLALADTAVSATMTSLDGVPIIVERSMWWPGPTPAAWAEAHNSVGSIATGTLWALAEGEQGGPSNAQTYLTIANTSDYAGQAKVTLLFEDGSVPAEVTVALPANSRTNVWPPVDVRAWFPPGTHRRFGALVESVGARPADIVVERPMYWDAHGVPWAAGTNAMGTRVR
jgi:hypothetical protein